MLYYLKKLLLYFIIYYINYYICYKYKIYIIDIKQNIMLIYLLLKF